MSKVYDAYVLESKDIGIRKSEFVAKTQFLWISELGQSLESYSLDRTANLQLLKWQKSVLHRQAAKIWVSILPLNSQGAPRIADAITIKCFEVFWWDILKALSD